MAIISTGDSPIDANTVDGTELAARLNRLYPAISSNHANATRPTYVTAGGMWTKFTSPSTYELMFYNGATDQKIEPGNFLLLTGGTVTGDFGVNGTTYLNGLVVGHGQTSSTIGMQDSDDGLRSIHCNSNRIGFLNQAGSWGAYCNDAGDWVCETRMTCANAPTLGTDLANKDYVDTKLTASTYTAADVLTKIKTVDGSGSGLDADTLDGYQASAFLIGTTWTAFTSPTRQTGTTYTNSTGKTIQVSVVLTSTDATLSAAYINVSGLQIGRVERTPVSAKSTVTAMVPPGATYSIESFYHTTATWHELI